MLRDGTTGLSFADVLIGQAPNGSSGNYGREEMTKAASAAAVGEVLGGFTKEAEEAIIGTMGASGAAFAAGIAEVLREEREKLAEVAGIVVGAIEKLAELTAGTAPLTSEGFPSVSRDGIGAPASEQQSKTEMSVNAEISGKGYPGQKGVSSELDKLLHARNLTNAAPVGGEKQTNSGTNPYPTPGHKISSAGAKLRSLLSKGMQGAGNAARKAKGAVSSAAESGVSKLHKRMGLNPMREHKSLQLTRAKSTGEKARDIGGKAKEHVQANKGRYGAGAAAAGAGLYGAHRMRHKEGGVDDSIGAHFRAALAELAGEKNGNE
jgi:hypothetical protein